MGDLVTGTASSSIIISFESKLPTSADKAMISLSTPSVTKIQPLPAAPSSPSSEDECHCHTLQGEQKQAVYTMWMKSLVFNGNGCTVYGADGCVAFRVDNYGCRGGRDVFFMDSTGNTLIRIQRKSFAIFEIWEACRCYDGGEGLGEETATPWFRVRKARKNGAAVTMHGSERTYRIDGCSRKSDYKISSADGAVVAAIGRKQTCARVCPGRGCSDTDNGAGDGSSACSGFGGRVWPYEPLHVMGAPEDFSNEFSKDSATSQEQNSSSREVFLASLIRRSITW